MLRLVIHSLYSHKEIFLRELISNASDACEKLRFEAIANPELLGRDALSVTLTPDTSAGTLSIKDNGIGMSEAEIIDNLGTIARSGTKKFLETLSGDSAKDAQLIGQFGVGFYSAFIVADKVTVLTKRGDSPAVRWESDGEGQYEIQAADKTERGTEVILHLRDEDKEFLEAARLRQLVRKYSDHLSIPIVLKTRRYRRDAQSSEGVLDAAEIGTEGRGLPGVLQAHLTHDAEDARVWAHNKVEGNIEYTSLLYLPKHAPFDLYDREQKRRHAAIRQARLHHGQGGGAVAAVLALHARTGGFVRFAVERVARAAAEQPHRGEDQVGAGQAHAGSARGSRRRTSRRNTRNFGKPSAWS